MRPVHFTIYSKKLEDNSTYIAKIKEELLKNNFIFDEDEPELIIILGGDGSFLRAVHDPLLPRGENIKYVLFNTGHLGFYSDYQITELDEFVHDLISVEPKIESLPFYRFTIDGKIHHCINDIAIQSGETVFLNVYIEDEFLTEARCNGIVVGTPTGSSGFLASLGAPIIIHGPDVYQYALLAPCRNRMFVNPIKKAVISGDQELRIEVDCKDTMEIYIDGGHKTRFLGKKFTFSHKNSEFVSLLHFRELSHVARIRKNISGKDD